MLGNYHTTNRANKVARHNYYRARFYSPALGRFLQTDPVGTRDDVNLYSYASNKPIDMVDPSGSDAYIAVSANGDIDIKVPIVFSGDAATRENINSFKDSFQRAFTGTFGNKNVKTTVVELSTEQAKSESVVNTMEISKGPVEGSNKGHSIVRSGSEGHLTMIDQEGGSITHPDGSTTSSEKGAMSGAHEGGHLLGLDDTKTPGLGLMDLGPGIDVTPGDIDTIVGNSTDDLVQNETPSGAVNTIVRCRRTGCN